MLLFVFIFPIKNSRVKTNNRLKVKYFNVFIGKKLTHPTVDDMINSDWNRCPEKFKSDQTETEDELMKAMEVRLWALALNLSTIQVRRKLRRMTPGRAFIGLIFRISYDMDHLVRVRIIE